MIPLDLMMPPHSLEAEQAVLGCALSAREASEAALEVLVPDDFFQPMYGTIFRAIGNLTRSGRGVDMTAVVLELQKDNYLESVGGGTAITEIMQRYSLTHHIRQYVETVKNYSMLRTLITRCAQVTADCYAHEMEPKEILEKAEKFIYTIAETGMGVKLMHIAQNLHEVIDSIDKGAKGGKVTGLTTGFNSLDTITSGFHPGNMIVIAARPGVGKTSFALDIARHVAVQEKQGVAFFSLEMTSNELALRLVSSLSKIPLYSLRTGYVKPGSWADITRATEMLSESPMHIDSTPQAITPLTIRTAARRLASKLLRNGSKLGLIVIDYLQLISSQGKKYETRQAEVADVSRSLKALAIDLKVPILALSQLNRQVEGRGDDGKPRLSDLRESGSIEQDADMVLFLCRDGMYKKDVDQEERGKTKLIIAKHRNGSMGEIDLDFNGEITSFSESPT